MARGVCEESWPLPIASLKKCGLLRGGQGAIRWQSFMGESRLNFMVCSSCTNPCIRFWHPQRDINGQREYTVDLDTTAPYFGGRRYWFICPLARNDVACGRRTGILYLTGEWLGCRSCYHLAYKSQQKWPTGFSGLASVCVRLGTKMESAKSRVRYWRGRPTKRYVRLLKAAGKLEKSSNLLTPKLQRRLIDLKKRV